MLKPLGQLLSKIFSDVIDRIAPLEPEIMLDYGDLQRPVAHIEPAEPIYGVGAHAQYGWNTLAKIMRERPEVKVIYHQKPSSQEQIKHVAEAIIKIAKTIENTLEADISIPLSRLIRLKEDSKYIYAIADAYCQTGTTFRLQEPADNVDMTNVRDMFSGSAALCDKAAGRTASNILREFIKGVEEVCHEKTHGTPYKLPVLPEDPSWHKGPPSPLRNRMPRRN